MQTMHNACHLLIHADTGFDDGVAPLLGICR